MIVPFLLILEANKFSMKRASWGHFVYIVSKRMKWNKLITVWMPGNSALIFFSYEMTPFFVCLLTQLRVLMLSKTLSSNTNWSAWWMVISQFVINTVWKCKVHLFPLARFGWGVNTACFFNFMNYKYLCGNLFYFIFSKNMEARSHFCNHSFTYGCSANSLIYKECNKLFLFT